MTAPNSTLDFHRARLNMVEQQVRPWDVLDQSVLDLLLTVRREDFVPLQYRALAFTDMEVPLRIDGADTGESMFPPRVEARFLQELAIKPHEHALEIGTGSGYMAALVAHKAHHVLTVEIDARLVRFSAANLARAGVRNVTVDLGDGARGWSGSGRSAAPYDVIIVSGALPVLPETLLAQLKVGGRLAAIVGEAPVMTAQQVTRVSAKAWETLKLFETCVKPLRNAWRPSTFRF